jgi:hypothetical protein
MALRHSEPEAGPEARPRHLGRREADGSTEAMESSMRPVEDVADAVILRWPKPLPSPEAKPTWKQRLSWLAFPLWALRLCAEMVGWLAFFGWATM